MIERLVTAYRAEIYDMTFSDIWKIIRQNWKFFILFAVIMLTVMALCFVGILCNLFFLIAIAVIVMLIAVLWTDRFVIRQHRNVIVNRMDHLQDFTRFLKSAIPTVNLYHAERIEDLISRLSVFIDERYPFRSFTNKAKQFATAVIIPLITYIAGAYTTLLQEQDLAEVLTLGTGVIVLLALAWFLVSMITDFLRPLFCRDYDAAVSMREDLLDIQLLYFHEKK